MNETRINYYLSSLESILKTALPTTRCAEIIIEVREKIQSQLDSGHTLDDVLHGLGSVDHLAKQYGVFYTPQSSFPAKIVKIIFIISLVFFLMFSFIIWKLANSFHTSFEKFSFEDMPDQFSIGGMTIPIDPQTDEELYFEEIDTADASTIKNIVFNFSNGKVRVSTSDETKISWRCRVRGEDNINRDKTEGARFELNYTNTLGVKCDLQIPKNTNLELKGGNGDVKVIKPDFNLDINIVNGRVVLLPDEGLPYKYDFKITNGRADEYKNSESSEARKVKITLSNGVVTTDGE